MQKIWAVILLSALASNYEALPQTKWSRPIRNPQGQLTRERRQFPFGDWIPLTQSCPTCRLFADPHDAGLRGENIGLTPPRPPTVTRQIHTDGNFFSQDESSILSVPPPPPSIATSNGNFQFSGFGQQFSSPPLPVPTQKIIPQTQQIQFFPQTFLQNQPLLVNGNQQILPGLNGQSSLFAQGQNQQQANGGKVTSFQNSEFKTQKFPENVVLEQNKRPFVNKAQPFTQTQQNQQQAFVQQQQQQQGFGGQRQHSVNFGNTILTPPPAPNNVSQDIVIPGLDKEEIQLLYVPVETLRQRGTPQEQLLTQQPQNIQFYNRPNGPQRPVNIKPTEQTLTQPAKGHFVTQNGNNAGQSDNTIKVTSSQPFSTSVTPSTLLLQHLPFQETPQPFVSVTPATPTLQSFVTPASAFQKFSAFTPETTLPQLSTVPNTIQFSQQSDVEFGTTPKSISSQGIFSGEIINRKPVGFSSQNGEERQLQRQLQQSFVSQQQVVTQQPQQNAVFAQENQKEIQGNGQFPNQIDEKQIALQKQQENQRLLQQQRQKEFDEQKFLQEQRKQKELEEQRFIQQQRQKELEQQRFLQKQKELEEQRLLQQQQQQRQKELEQQRFLQKQKELEEQRLLQQQQQRQKELEQQRFLQKQKELEEQRLLQQQQRQKELEQQRFLQKQKELEEQRLLQQQQRQKELEQQRFLQEQRQKELEHQRRLQLQQQKELEEKRLLQQLKQKEEEQQRALRFQLQQKELEQQKLLQAQRENQQRLLQQQEQENLKNQQQFQFFQQQQQKQNLPQQSFQQQPNRHVLPDNDKLNFIPQLEKESASEDQQLVPHQPPLSVFFKGYNGAEPRITDVLRELRSSNTITVLDQYFEKMPKVFVGPAGLIPPPGYGKFDLPYLSNLDSNRIERRIDKLPFFVAPLNFVPPPGYAKIPFPSPHVGSVVVSSESNPAMKLKSVEAGIGQTSVEEENISGSYPVVGPELPGLINNLDTITTTIKPSTYVSTPSLPQTTAQLRNRRPNSSLYKPQNRKPISRTRSSTTSKPEEEVTQPIQKTEVTKDSEGIRKPLNRFLHRRRQQTKTTTESALKGQQEGKSLENRFYSVEVYHQDKNQVPRTQIKTDVIQESQAEGQSNGQFEHSTGSIDRITPGGHGVFKVRPTPDYSRTQQIAGTVESEEGHPDSSDYLDINLQTFEDGPLPTGSAKTITQELYRPNAIRQPEGEDKTLSKSDSIFASDKFQPESHEDVLTTKFPETSDVSPTTAADTASAEQVNLQPTSVVETEKQDASSERYSLTEISGGEVSFTPRTVTAAEDGQTKGFLDSNEQYTSAFAEISKHHHIPGFADSSKRHPSTFPDVYPTSEISTDLQAPLSSGFDASSSGEAKPSENAAEFSTTKFLPTGSPYESYSTGFEGTSQSQQADILGSRVLPSVSPTAPGAIEGEYSTGFPVNSQAQNSAEINKHSDDERIASFINLHHISATENSQQHFPSSTPQPVVTESNPVIVEQYHASPTPETIAEVTVSPFAQTYTSGSVRDKSTQHSDSDQTQVTESHGQEVADNLANDHRLKLPNPSIVRVRTRVRGKSRGQLNFAASQSTTSAPYTRSVSDSKHNENTDQDLTTKTNHFRDYHPTKTSKYNQFRGIKKPARPTTEATTEYDQKANVYTIRPQRRPLSPSTVSTKRIRRPTTPLPSVEPHTEVFGISSQSDHSDISPSGVSNDVYYEQSSLSPVKNKFRKHFGSAEHKNDVVPVYSSTAFPSTLQPHSTTAYDSEDSNIVREMLHTEAPDRYPDWNPSESGFDVSGIVFTTIRTTDQAEPEEPKKAQESKKAFDPDLEKKTGRRRVRVRVHKRPHENFETAESQNLRTVANVLVPPTTTYKPNDESGFHQLAKNVDFSFGGQKLFGVRSREYFRKRLNLNLTEPEGVSKGDESTGDNIAADKTAAKSSGRKSQTNEVESASGVSNESSEGNKVARPKFRGFVRKVVKHGGARKEESESHQTTENEENEDKAGSGELHSRQPFRVNNGGFNHTGRGNGIKHKTFVRYVKKNKVRQHETESHVEPNFQEIQKEGEDSNQSEPKSQVQVVNAQQTSTTASTTEFPVTKVHSVQEDNSESQQQESTEAPEVRETQQPSVQTTPADEPREIQENSTYTDRELTSRTPSTTPPTQQGGLYFTQRSRFFQTLRPVFQKTSQAALYRTREPEAPSSTTEQTVTELQEKRNGYSRFKYGRTTTSSTLGVERTDESKKVSEQELKNKTLHTLEVRKYLRSKNREGAFSQFSRNRYVTSDKTESDIAKDEGSSEKESEELTTERNIETTQTESSSTEAKTTQLFVRTDSIQVERDTTKLSDELQPTTTEAIISEENASEEEEEEGEEEDEEEEEGTSSSNLETTTETEIPTTAFRASGTERPEKVTTEGTTEAQTTEAQPDIYRFSKNSFSFDETENFTGTKNRAWVRNITTDIIENTASFSAPGVEKRPDIRVVKQHADEVLLAATESGKEKTEEATTEADAIETTTTTTAAAEYSEAETTAAAEAITKAKLAKILKTSTTTKISHETEICYRGKCIRTKSENPDDDLKLLVDSASTTKTEKPKT